MTLEQVAVTHNEIPVNLDSAAKTKPGVITILEPSLSYGFTQLPRPVLKARGLSRNAKTLYALLLDYAWQSGSCFPGQTRLADDLDISVDSIRRDLDELRKYGLISWQRRPGLSATNIYYIHRLTDCERLELGVGDTITDITLGAHPENVRHIHLAPMHNVTTASMRHKQDSEPNKTQTENTQPTPLLAKTTRRGKSACVVDVNKKATQPEGAFLDTVTDVDAITLALMPEAIELITLGWQQAKAVAFVEQYGEERISRHLEALRFLQRRRPDAVRDAAAWVRRAVEEDWPTPTTPAEPPRNAFFATSQHIDSLPVTDETTSDSVITPNRDKAVDMLWSEIVPRLRPTLSVAKTLWLSKAHLTTDDALVRRWLSDRTPLPATHQPSLCLTLNRRWQLNELVQTDLYYIEMLLNDCLGVKVKLSFSA